MSGSKNHPILPAILTPLILAATQSFGVGGEPDAGVPNVAVVDVARVLENSQVLTRELKTLRDERDNYEQKVREHDRNTRARIQQLCEDLSGLNKDTSEYDELVAELSHLRALFQIDLHPPLIKSPDTSAREAAAYRNAFQRFQRAVDSHVKRNNIALVLRYEPEIRPSDIAGVLACHDGVVWSNLPDITDAVIELMATAEREQTAGSHTCDAATDKQ